MLALETLTVTEEGARSRGRQIERLGAQFEAIVRLHLEKLEQIYLPFLEQFSEEGQLEVVEGMALEDASLAPFGGGRDPTDALIGRSHQAAQPFLDGLEVEGRALDGAARG